MKEVEDVLLRHPKVTNVAVIAQPHDRLGEVGCAVVLPQGDAPTLSELTTFLDEHAVTKQFWPEALIIVDEFPMTPSGKIQKFQLRNLLL